MQTETYSERLFKSYRETHGEDCIDLKEAYMLEVLTTYGYKNINGIDLSPEDIKLAQERLKGRVEEVVCVDAFDYLSDRNDQFDIIYCKAVMEHIKKDKIFDFLELINNSLTDDGMVLLEVPNMDWIWASHERYMDFTHELGFTKESLAQIMRNIYKDVYIEYTDNAKRYHGIKTFLSRFVLWPVLYWLEPQIPSKEALFARSIMGIGKKNIVEL